MKTIRTFILIIALAFVHACYDDSSSNCYIPIEIQSATDSYEVMGAGSNQYNGIYTTDRETKVNGKFVYKHHDNSLYIIEYDTSNVWCIKDNGILEYCMLPFSSDNFPGYSSTHGFPILHNGISSGPTFEEITQPWFLKCGEL